MSHFAGNESSTPVLLVFINQHIAAGIDFAIFKDDVQCAANAVATDQEKTD